MRKRISSAKPAVKARIVISNKETGKHEVQVSMDGKNYISYKSGSGLTIDEAYKERMKIKGVYSLFNDIIDNRK
jgi:hypothetical protein